MTDTGFAGELHGTYDRYRVPGLDTGSRHASPDTVHGVIDALLVESHGRLGDRIIGRSFEGRPIRALTLGTGPVAVLLWSQMHGDEPTATAAVLDIINYLLLSSRHTHEEPMLGRLALTFVPMLNPDGAARVTRRTAQGIDMNRDALALVTPEARLLKQLRDALRPAFGFNLHDQELSTVGSSRELTAMSLLAPAADDARSVNGVVRRARHLAAAVALTAGSLAPGRIARYDDTFEPRAFGDNMQRWGTSTLLVESGHAAGDPEKHSIRRLNFAGILAGLAALAGGDYMKSDLRAYTALPFNGKRAYDIIIRNVTVGSTPPFSADLGVSRQVDTHSEDPAKLVDVGDLSTFAALREIDGGGATVPPARLALGAPFDWPGL